MDLFHEIAARHGGECLSTSYHGERTVMHWRCAKGHQWSAKAASAIRGSWCRTCWREDRAGSHLVLHDGLEQARDIAQKKDGDCLSDAYVRATDRMRWRCANGHEWTATFADVKRGTWCPVCRPWNRERLCRSVLEQMYGARFPKVFPKWLSSRRGTKLELDGYNEELGIAFEHQGKHHYSEVEHFHRAPGELARIKEDDDRKMILCADRGIVLVQVPYTVPIHDLGAWIGRELRKANAKKPMVEGVDVHMHDDVGDAALAELRAIATERGGACLSSTFMGVTVKHRFRCGLGHEWEAVPFNVKNGTWCFHCKPAAISKSRMDPNGLERLRRVAEERGGELLSATYLGVNEHHEWRCAAGHEWSSAPTDALKGAWCRTCYLNRRYGPH